MMQKNYILINMRKQINILSRVLCALLLCTGLVFTGCTEGLLLLTATRRTTYASKTKTSLVSRSTAVGRVVSQSVVSKNNI